jgi:VanZ family protein
MKIRLIFLLASLVSVCAVKADSTTINYKKRNLLLGGLATGTVLTHTGLYFLWYDGYPSQPFTWINDNKGWLQMDKAGHAFSAFAITHSASTWFRNTGMSKQRSAVYGTVAALAFQTPIEIFDGFSAGWGASAGDLLANTTGALLAGFQHYYRDDAPLIMRWSYGKSEYADLRPGMLGSSPKEKWLKDYNAQTYWLSYTPKSTIRGAWPAWLGIAVGYSGGGMLGSESNIWTDKQGQLQDYSHITRYRQWLISPDIRLSRIPVQNKNLRFALSLFDFWRFPLPALEMRGGTFRFHPIYR